MIETWLFSFGQDHTHRLTLNGKGITMDCEGLLAIRGDIESTRLKMFDLCGPKWAMQYEEKNLSKNPDGSFHHFPRGIVVTIDA